MNQSNSTVDATLLWNVSEPFFFLLGSTFVIDTAYMFISPLFFMGIILNFISFAVFVKIGSNTTAAIFKYLKFYTLNSIVLCSIASLQFISYAPRYIGPFSIGLFAGINRCILGRIVEVAYCNGNVMDVLIIYERLAIFNKKFKIPKKISPYALCFVCLTIVTFIMSPLFFWNTLRDIKDYEKIMLNPYSVDEEFTYCTRTAFYYSKLNSYLTIIVIVIRDLFTLTAELVASILIIKYFKKFMDKKKKFAITNHNASIRPKNIRTLSQSDTDLSKMTIALSIFSLIFHFIGLITYIFVIKSTPFVYYASLCLGSFIVAVKQFFNFFIFLSFNSLFRKAFKCLSQTSS